MKNKILLPFFLFLFIRTNAQIGDPPPPPAPPPPPPRVYNEKNYHYDIRTKHHSFPGCESTSDKNEKWLCAYLKREIFIAGNLVYPDEAFEKNIEGIVIVKYFAEKEGSITNLKLIHGIGGGCDEEAIRVVGRMPKMEPGSARGRPFREPQFVAINFDKNKHRHHRLRYTNYDWRNKLDSVEQNRLEFFAENLNYPKHTFENADQGIVVVKIFANKKGEQSFLIETGIDYECDQEALRLVKLMPAYSAKNWATVLNKETQYVPVLFSIYAYNLWKNKGEKNE